MAHARSLAAGTGQDLLAEERRNPGFEVGALQALIWGGEERAERARELGELVANQKVFSKEDSVQVPRSAAMRRSLQKARRGIELVRLLNLKEEDRWLLFLFIDDINFTSLHWYMFLPALEGQASPEQQRLWLPPARAMHWLGCYAQTELGHGSNVQGLETSATFLEHEDAFELNSPTLSSTKWWPGALGKVSTHAIVYARLLLPQKEPARGTMKDYGVHAFLVQLRSLENHRPLPGITVGDIGPKFGNGGYNTMDNGFLRFNRVRIPRTNLLMRYVEVSRSGEYCRVNESARQLAYGAMVNVRKGIVMEAGLFLARAATIAVRYSCVRRQFGEEKDTVKGGVQEKKVMDYPTQQRRALPLLASAYAFIFVGHWMVSLYNDLVRRIQAGDLSTLAEVHAASAGLKAFTTTVTANGIEECRKLCGGHGYLCSSGLPQLFAAYVPACTYEGDNVVLLLQVARYLLKAMSQVSQGHSPSGTAQYLEKAPTLQGAVCSAQSAQDFLGPWPLLLEPLQAAAIHLSARAGMAVAQAPNAVQGFQDNSVELARAAKAHCTVIVASNFVNRVQGLEAEAPSRVSSGAESGALQQLCRLYMLTALEDAAGDLLECGYFQQEHPQLVREATSETLLKVRQICVPLVDAFGFTDHYLNSALGRFDGNVYEDLYRRAAEDPINAVPVSDAYEESIRPILKGQAKGILKGLQAKL